MLRVYFFTRVGCPRRDLVSFVALPHPLHSILRRHLLDGAHQPGGVDRRHGDLVPGHSVRRGPQGDLPSVRCMYVDESVRAVRMVAPIFRHF